MTTVLLALGGAAAAAALTWFFCMRPMLRNRRSGAAGTDATAGPACCAQPTAGIGQQITAAREELARLRAAQPPNGPGALPMQAPGPLQHPGPVAGQPEATR